MTISHALWLTLEMKRSLLHCSVCRWSEVTRRLELWVQILELNDAGEFVPVEVQPAKDVCTGGIFQLKQVCVDINDSTRCKTSSWHIISLIIWPGCNVFYNAIHECVTGSVQACSCGDSFSPGLRHHASDHGICAQHLHRQCGGPSEGEKTNLYCFFWSLCKMFSHINLDSLTSYLHQTRHG